MPSKLSALVCVSALALSLLALAGCSGGAGGGASNVKVSGSVARNGKPLPVGQGMLSIIFISQANPEVQLAADTEEGKHTFTIYGIAPGKYKVAVEHVDPTGRDVLKGAYSAAKTTIEQEVTSANDQSVVINLK
jgi:hypothetical protein